MTRRRGRVRDPQGRTCIGCGRGLYWPVPVLVAACIGRGQYIISS